MFIHLYDQNIYGSFIFKRDWKDKFNAFGCKDDIFINICFSAFGKECIHTCLSSLFVMLHIQDFYFQLKIMSVAL